MFMAGDRRDCGSIARVIGTALMLIGVACGCAAAPATTPVVDPGIGGDLTDMQIRIQMLQSQLNDLRQTMRDRGAREAASSDAVELRLALLQDRLDTLPEDLLRFCPAVPDSATVTTQYEGFSEVQRVVVSGDKLVVGELERVWIDPPEAMLVARIDPSSDASLLAAEDIVEFERDGSRWVRFAVQVGDELETVERPIKRSVRVAVAQGGTARRPVVDLRLQLGDVHQSVDFALTDALGQDHAMVLGRNFLTDVAMVDIGARFVQPAVRRPRQN
jgi:hypothetical protein